MSLCVFLALLRNSCSPTERNITKCLFEQLFLYQTPYCFIAKHESCTRNGFFLQTHSKTLKISTILIPNLEKKFMKKKVLYVQLAICHTSVHVTCQRPTATATLKRNVPNIDITILVFHSHSAAHVFGIFFSLMLINSTRISFR